MTNNTDPKLMLLEPRDMHGPVEVRMFVRFKVGDKNASMEMMFPPGTLPTRSEQIALLDSVMDPAKLAASPAPAGTRAMTKPEFVEYLTKRETGQATPMQGDQHFVPAQCEIPHGMLVHAIVGAQLPVEFGDEYIGSTDYCVEPE
jgi:hypothetical protein